jgi:hypothetical protein
MPDDMQDETRQRIEASFAKQAFMTTLGARLVHVAAGEIEIELPVSAASRPSSTASSMPARSPPSPIPLRAMPR